MNERKSLLAVLHYEEFDQFPIVHFGFWPETLQKWAAEGHITAAEATSWHDGSPSDYSIGDKLGFDYNYSACFAPDSFLRPCFEPKVLEEMPDGSRKYLNHEGVIVLDRDEAGSIPAEIEHLLKNRADWEKEYRHRLVWSSDRVLKAGVRVGEKFLTFDGGGQDFLVKDDREYLYGLFCGSLMGRIRNILGVVGLSYMMVDDEELLDEIIEVCGNLCYRCTKTALESGAKFDFAHFWEDICFKNGPLVKPDFFYEKVGPQYARITELLTEHGIDIVSVDCDGMIDALIPTWLDHGVNTMFPIEVGTWNASIAPWREKYGRNIRGVGGMNKVVYSRDRDAVDQEIERLKPLVKLGGFVPCPDHRIPPDAEWDNVRYYCDKLRESLA